MTDGVDAPAETEADAAVSVSGQHLVPVHAPRRYQVRRSLLAALAIAVLVSAIVIERRTLARSLRVLTNLDVGWFLLAVAAEAISLTSFGLSRRRLVRGASSAFPPTVSMALTGSSTGWRASGCPG